jgi:hypothetical protein
LKLEQEKSGNTLEAMGIVKYFLSSTPVAQQVTERINKRDYMKLNRVCITKLLVSKLKKLPTEWEKIFAGYTSDKGLITRIYRELKKLNSPQINDPIKNGQLN